MKSKFIKTYDKTKIHIYIWDNVTKPIGVVQIFHGMAEHAKRYDELARALNKAGYIVYADDHRGHGLTCKDKLGTYNGPDMFNDTVKDEIFISSLIKKTYKLPLYIFGHSYGSFLAQSYITKCALYEKVILCGSALMKNRLDVFFGKIVARMEANRKGLENPSYRIVKLSFGKYNKQVKEGSWLNTISSEVDKYKKDEYCGFVCSNKFYLDFFSAFRKIYGRNARKNINKDKPILIISGWKDPVGSMGKSVKRLKKYFTHLGVTNVELKLYPNVRHEILNDVSKKEVMNDIVAFLKK